MKDKLKNATAGHFHQDTSFHEDMFEHATLVFKNDFANKSGYSISDKDKESLEFEKFKEYMKGK